MTSIMFETLNRSISDISFWIGLVSLCLFARSRFAVSLPDGDDLSPPIPSRSFTTRFRYEVASFTYIGVYVFLYFILLLVGSYPTLQEWLTRWVGELQIEGQAIGTPMWASLAASTLLPSAPGFKTADDVFREMLHDFASIPRKARLIAHEIRSAIDADIGGFPESAIPKNPEDANLAFYNEMAKFQARRFEWLKQVKEALEVRDGGKDYVHFFSEHAQVWEAFESEFDAVPQRFADLKAARYFVSHLAKSNKRASRYIVCAMLHVEPTEYRVRTRLNGFGLSMASPGFELKTGHLFIASVTVLLMSLLGYMAAAWLYAVDTARDPAAFLASDLDTYFLWTVLAVMMYMLPIILAAGSHLYIIDRSDLIDPQDNLTTADRISIIMLTFIGSMGLAFISLLCFISIRAAVEGRTTLDIQMLQILPWTLPAAGVAVTFLVMTLVGRVGNRAVQMVLDLLAHGTVAVLMGYVAVYLATLAGATFATLEPGLIWYFATISTGITGASVGVVLCMLTRRRIPSGSERRPKVRGFAGIFQ